MKHFLVVALMFVPFATSFAQDEAEFQTWMKTTGATAGSLRKNLEAKSSEAAAADATKLEGIFKEVHGFWMKKNVEPAAKLSTEAENGFKEVGQLASASKFDEASASLKKTMAGCAGCHSVYREKAPDGSYKIKYN